MIVPDSPYTVKGMQKVITPQPLLMRSTICTLVEYIPAVLHISFATCICDMEAERRAIGSGVWLKKGWSRKSKVG